MACSNLPIRTRDCIKNRITLAQASSGLSAIAELLVSTHLEHFMDPTYTSYNIFYRLAYQANVGDSRIELTESLTRMATTPDVNRSSTNCHQRRVAAIIQRRFVAMTTDAVKAGDLQTSFNMRPLNSVRFQIVLELQLSANHSTCNQHTAIVSSPWLRPLAGHNTRTDTLSTLLHCYKL